MPGQESTLFGGWAKVRIPQPIKIGAYEHLEKFSLSASEQTFHFDMHASGQTESGIQVYTEALPEPRITVREEESRVHLCVARPDIALVVEPDGVHVSNPVLNEAIRLFRPREILLDISLQRAKPALTFPALSPAQFLYDLRRRGLRLETMEDGVNLKLSGPPERQNDSTLAYILAHQSNLSRLLSEDAQFLAQLIRHGE